jgi:hypothetical protein
MKPVVVVPPLDPVVKTATLAESERQLWWFRGMKRILFALLVPVLKRAQRRLMAVGSGTRHWTPSLVELQ